MTDLQTIVYLSTAVQEFTTSELESLLSEARDLNLESGVTGVLLYDKGNFIQCFEGSVESVKTTYDRILASRRHKDIIELLNESIEERTFADWQMGFAKVSKPELLALTTSRWQGMLGGTSSENLKSPGLFLLHSFWKRACQGVTKTR